MQPEGHELDDLWNDEWNDKSSDESSDQWSDEFNADEWNAASGGCPSAAIQLSINVRL